MVMETERKGVGTMLRRGGAARVTLAIIALLLAWSSSLTMLAQKSSVPKTQDKPALGEEDVKRLISLMDTDKDGTVSREEFMKFMEEEFKSLDKNKDGTWMSKS